MQEHLATMTDDELHELREIAAELVTALEKILDAPGLPMLDQYGDAERMARAAIAKAKVAIN